MAVDHGVDIRMAPIDLSVDEPFQEQTGSRLAEGLATEIDLEHVLE
jgi:hypothetical protein